MSMIANLRKYLEEVGEKIDEDHILDNLAYTLGQRRSVFQWIAAAPARNRNDLIDSLAPSNTKPCRMPEAAPRLGFVFTGQGAQWYAMGRELIEAYPVFKQSLCEADQCLKDLGCPWSMVGMKSAHISSN